MRDGKTRFDRIKKQEGFGKTIVLPDGNNYLVSSPVHPGGPQPVNNFRQAALALLPGKRKIVKNISALFRRLGEVFCGSEEGKRDDWDRCGGIY
jgi:hypothetical protein